MTSIAFRDVYPSAAAGAHSAAAARCAVKETVPNAISAWRYAVPRVLLVVHPCYCVFHDCSHVVDPVAGIAAVVLKARDTAKRRLVSRSL